MFASDLFHQRELQQSVALEHDLWLLIGFAEYDLQINVYGVDFIWVEHDYTLLLI